MSDWTPYAVKLAKVEALREAADWFDAQLETTGRACQPGVYLAAQKLNEMANELEATI